jgi:hypothetical protein
MEFDPAKLVKAGGEVAETVGFLKKVLPLIQIKPAKARRKGDWDPRRDKDRRISGIQTRLKTGIWLHFHYKTGIGKFELLDPSESPTAALTQAFMEESVHYEFRDRNSLDTTLAAATIATPAADFALAKWLQLPSDRRHPVLLAEEFGAYVYLHYDVRPFERRRPPQPQSVYESIALLFERARAFFSKNNHQKRRKEDWAEGVDGDRRKSSAGSRLRHGTWIQYHRRTGDGIYQVPRRLEEKDLIRAFTIEGAKYDFTDPALNAPAKLSDIAPAAASFACAKWMELAPKERRAFVLVEQMASYVTSRYTVTMVDRRKDDNHHQAVAG